MRVPLSWLRDFAPFDLDPKELGLVFDDLGMVVEGIEYIGGGLDGVVVARILSIEPIEGLDRVRMTRVDAGDGEPLEVACGAWNIEPGHLVPLATIGTTLPNGMTIGRRKLKKVYSNGMLCSAVELGMGEDADGILLLDDSIALGTPIAQALSIEHDVVYDLAIEGNRPDANCVLGVARDAAARLGLPFTVPDPAIDRAGAPTHEAVSVRIDAPLLCPRFTASILSGVSVGPSPDWVQRRLVLGGMRPINNVVDASNYVMLELGQPTHPYDLRKVAGPALGVRAARAGETVETLDGVERVLGRGTHDDAVIIDGDDRAIGIAGIMGGASTEIDETTTDVLLEAASFERMAIARTSKRLGLRSEASMRFERGVDPYVIDLAIRRFAEVLGSGSLAPDNVDVRGDLEPRRSVPLRTERVNALLGTSLDAARIDDLLAPLGFEVERTDDAEAEVTPPSFRPDVEIEVDLIEEVARHHGYAAIERTVPRAPQVGGLSRHQRARRLVRNVLVGAGVSEAQTPSLVGPSDHARAHLEVALIRAANPMILEESVLRASLLPGLLRALAFNAARRQPEVALFEIGMVWSSEPDDDGDRAHPDNDVPLPVETERLMAVVAGKDVDATSAVRLWHEVESGLRLTDVSLAATAEPGLHAKRSARISCSGAAIGTVGEVDPSVLADWSIPGRVGVLDLDLRALLNAPSRPLEQQSISRFPSSDLDLAFVVDESTPAGALERAIRESAGELLEDVTVFDVYRGDRVPPGARGVAFRLRFVAVDRTLNDTELAELRERVVTTVSTATGATLRTT